MILFYANEFPEAPVIYIPGYGSNQNSNTYAHLSGQPSFDAACVNYDNHDPQRAEAQLTQQINELRQGHETVYIVASSLGGYWGNRMAQKLHLPCLLINPAITPNISLSKYGLPEEILSKFPPSTADPAFRIVFLGAQDDIVDPYKTSEFFKGKARIIWLENEGHRLQDMRPLLEALDQCLSGAGPT